ncbi:MAG: hypothetical protein Q8N47_28140 [Bryobacterales bacterium]|nr:hypothetical protein [Bryobacterales bacterium]
MRNRILLSAIAVACLARAQAPETPRLGWLRDASGALRPLQGFAANFVTGQVRESGVLSVASSGTWALAKTNRELIVLDPAGAEAGRLPAPDGDALFAFALNGEPAVALFPETGLLLLWSGGRFETAGWKPARDEEMLAVAGAISFLMRRGDAVWRVDRAVPDGRLTREQALPGVGAPALLRPDGSVLYVDGKDLVLRSPDAGEQRVGLPGTATALNELAGDWVCVRLPDRQVAVSFSSATPRVFELPGGER